MFVQLAMGVMRPYAIVGRCNAPRMFMGVAPANFYIQSGVSEEKIGLLGCACPGDHCKFTNSCSRKSSYCGSVFSIDLSNVII